MANNLTAFISFPTNATASDVLSCAASGFDVHGGDGLSCSASGFDVHEGVGFVCTLSALNDKFSKDEFCLDNDSYKIYLCGCVLNATELLAEYNCTDISCLIPLLYAKYGTNITTVLKGVYTLLVVDKTAKTTFIANDLLSKKPLFYYKSDIFLAFSNSFSELLSLLSCKNVPLKADNLAAAMMMSEGFLWDDVTFAEGVKYLRPFEYLFIENSSDKAADKNFDKSDHQFFCTLSSVENRLGFSFAKNPISYNDAIETFDRIFRNAVCLQFEKARAYGYLPIASLSAGMDSRSVVLLGHSLGYTDITCFTYAQSGSVDDSIAKKIAYDYNLDHVFYELDGARFILDIDSAFALNNGEQTYCGATGAKKMGEMLDSNRYGIIHTGVLGGELMGDVGRPSKLIPPIDGISDTITATTLDKEKISARYKAILEKYSCNQKLELQKHLRACQNFAHMTSGEFLSLSPFLDEDVYVFLASLPLEYKEERKLYVSWMNKHLPNDYITTHMYGKPRSNGLLRKGKYALRILKGKLFGKSKYDMNPFDYWAKTLPSLVPALRKQLHEAIDIIDKRDDSPSQIVSILKEHALSCQLDILIKAMTVAKAVGLVEQAREQGDL